MNERIERRWVETRPCIDGSTNTYAMRETNVFADAVLGAELTDAHSLRTIECDHLESQDEEGIEILRGLWAKKSLVKSVVWQTDAAGIQTVARVTFARPL